MLFPGNAVTAAVLPEALQQGVASKSRQNSLGHRIGVAKTPVQGIGRQFA